MVRIVGMSIPSISIAQSSANPIALAGPLSKASRPEERKPPLWSPLGQKPPKSDTFVAYCDSSTVEVVTVPIYNVLRDAFGSHALDGSLWKQIVKSPLDIQEDPYDIFPS